MLTQVLVDVYTTGQDYKRYQKYCWLDPLLFPYRGGRRWALISERKIVQADFTDHLPFNPMKEITLIQKPQHK